MPEDITPEDIENVRATLSDAIAKRDPNETFIITRGQLESVMFHAMLSVHRAILDAQEVGEDLPDEDALAATYAGSAVIMTATVVQDLPTLNQKASQN